MDLHLPKQIEIEIKARDVRAMLREILNITVILENIRSSLSLSSVCVLDVNSADR